MMKLTKFILLFITLTVISCKSDDDGGGVERVPLRDQYEVAEENQQQIEDFLETHFYKMVDNPANSNFQRMEFDTIAGENSEETPVMDSPYLKKKTVAQGDSIDHTLYYLKIQDGAETEYQPTFADAVVATYKGESLTGDIFAEIVNPERTELINSDPQQQNFGTPTWIRGLTAAITEFKGASGSQENGDGTVSYQDDFGIGAVFVPSGLGFLNDPSAVKAYQPAIFTFQLYKAIQRDHDGDGIPSYMEDLEGTGNLMDTDSDGDGYPNFFDPDDDGDGTPTKDEIDVNDDNGKDWISEDDIIFTDSNNNGTPDYLDPEVN